MVAMSYLTKKTFIVIDVLSPEIIKQCRQELHNPKTVINSNSDIKQLQTCQLTLTQHFITEHETKISRSVLMKAYCASNNTNNVCLHNTHSSPPPEAAKLCLTQWRDVITPR